MRSGTLPTDYTFTGQKLDASSGLMYYGARYYDAAIGRFAQPDSIVPNLYNPQSLNRYSYVLNNPGRYTDPTGHAYCDDHVCPGDDDSTDPPGSAGGIYTGTNDETRGDSGPGVDLPVQTGGQQVPVTSVQQASDRCQTYVCTLAFGGSLQLNWMFVAVDIQPLLILDTHGNYAIVLVPSAGGGATLTTASASFTVQITGAADVDALVKSATVYLGGSVTPGAGPSVGGDFIFGERFIGWAGSLGVGAGSLAEIHAVTSGREGPLSTHVFTRGTLPSGHYDPDIVVPFY